MTRRGFTLAELVINTGLVALLATVVLMIVIRGLRIGIATYNHLDLSQRVALAARQWTTDVANSAPSGISLGTPGMIAQSLSWVDQDAAPTWNPGWTVYRQDGPRLYRSEWKDGITWEPLRAAIPSASQKTQVWGSPGPRERQLLKDVSSFTVGWGEGTRVLTLNLAVKSGEDNWEVSRSVELRNE